MNTGRDALQTICFPNNYRALRKILLTIQNLLRSNIKANIVNSTRTSRLVALSLYLSLIKAVTLALTLIAPNKIAAADSRLIMVTSDHCSYCQAWELDVGAVYDKSPYARTLPLTRVDIGSKKLEDVTFQKPVVGTPTFLIIHNGQEIDRQNGYIGAEMFWWWLSEYAAE